MALFFSLSLSPLLCDFLAVEGKFATVKRNNGSEEEEKKEKKEKKEKNDADGTWARYGSRVQNSVRKISGSCENFRNSSRCLQAIVDLPCPFSRLHLEDRFIRALCAERERCYTSEEIGNSGKPVLLEITIAFFRLTIG